MRLRDAYLIDHEYIDIGFLRPFEVYDLGKDGDATRSVLQCEYTLVVKNEAAHGLCADLSGS